MDRTRVLLAIPHPRLRQAIRESLESLGDIEVVAEVGSGLATLHAAWRLLPDVVLLDLHLPDVRGLEIASRLVRELPSLRVVLLGDEEADAYRKASLNSGAKAYLSTLAPAEELQRALRR